MKQITPEQRAAAIARILAVAEAKRADEEQREPKDAEAQREARRIACAGYTRAYHARLKAKHEAEPAMRASYLEKRRARDRANYHRKKANQ